MKAPLGGSETQASFISEHDKNGQQVVPASHIPAKPESSRNRQSLGIEELTSLALENNPGIREAIAVVQSLHGKQLQVGLRPNPQVGYISADMGEEGTAGQQGAFLSQTLIRGGKLSLNRSVVSQEINAAETNVEIISQQLRVEVQQRFTDLLVAKEKVRVVKDFERQFDKSARVSQTLFKEQEISKIANLRTQLQVKNINLIKARVEKEMKGASQRLIAVVFPGRDIQEQLDITGSIETPADVIEQDSQLATILEQSPEMVRSFAELEQSKWNLRRQMVEPVRDIQFQASLTHGNVTDDELVAVQLGMPLLINDRNQGNIMAARAKINAAEESIQKLEQDLSKRFATAWRDYQVNRTQLDQYQTDVIPAAQENLKLVEFAFQEGEMGYLDLINAQQTMLQATLDSLDVARDFWRSHWLLKGNLLAPE